MSPTTYRSGMTSRSGALATVEAENKAKGLMRSSYSKLFGEDSEENLSPQMKQILDLRRAVAMQEVENELEVEKKFGPLRRQLEREAQEEEIGYSQFRQRTPIVGTKYGVADTRGIGKATGFGSGAFSS